MGYTPQGALIGLSTLLVVAVLMFAFGRWGQRNAAGLLPADVAGERRLRKQRQLHRGGIAWQVVGVLFAMGSIVGIVNILIRS